MNTAYTRFNHIVFIINHSTISRLLHTELKWLPKFCQARVSAESFHSIYILITYEHPSKS